MAKRRHIVVVTGSRAEFGLLAPVMRAVRRHPRLRLSVVAAGAHLVSGTWRDLVAGGFTIAARVPMQRRGAVGRLADVAALGRGIMGMGRALARLKPDVVVVLGDRIEVLATACATQVGGYPLAHLHGGDRAQGVADEAIRHAVTKLAQVHFPATQESRRRLIKMGEPAEHVFLVGSPALDGLAEIAPAPDDELTRLGLDPAAPFVVVAQHPIGAPDVQEERWMHGTLQALRHQQGIVLAPNLDPGRNGIMAALRRAHVTTIDHLPREKFVALVRRAAAVVGNSSAGLIEVAALGVPSVNVGPRQADREQPASVFACDYGPTPVARALARALAWGKRRHVIRHPYGDGHTGERVAHLLATLDWSRLPLAKRLAY